MRLFVVCLILFLLFSCDAFSHSFFFKTKRSDQPHLVQTSLWLKARDSQIKNVMVEVKGQIGPLTQEKWIKQIQSSSFSACRYFPCDIPLMVLPLALHEAACEIVVSLTNLQGQVQNTQHKWGKCQQRGSKAPDRFLPDLSLSEENLDVRSFIFTNEGAGITSKKVRFFAFVENSLGEVVWSSHRDELLTLATGGQYHVELFPTLEQWQITFGCQGYIILDSEHMLYEKKKKNNELKFPFGLCKPAPSIEQGDKYDFVPLVFVHDNKFLFKVKNQGALPLLHDFERLGFDIAYKNAHGNLLFKRRLTVTAPLYGLGSEKHVFQEGVLEGVCRVVAQVNTHFTLAESDYNNNFIELNICQ